MRPASISSSSKCRVSAHWRVDAAHGLPIALVASSSGKDRKSTRLNSSHGYISYAVFCLQKKEGPARDDVRAEPERPRGQAIEAAVLPQVTVGDQWAQQVEQAALGRAKAGAGTSQGHAGAAAGEHIEDAQLFF